jgi:hypothetical protein
MWDGEYSFLLVDARLALEREQRERDLKEQQEKEMIFNVLTKVDCHVIHKNRKETV